MLWLIWCLSMGTLNVVSYVDGDSHLIANLIIGCLCFICSGYQIGEVINKKLNKKAL